MGVCLARLVADLPVSAQFVRFDASCPCLRSQSVFVDTPV
ncbi:hypothetical protein GGE46_005515 [Rhizobium etli]|uniref:Uncharacterized protein n=1 Tax=Rhizobium etli TaxID=29449 RepID=A0A7W6VGM8_RHIET|nr:hypothetical protein [Rhizobium etli]